MVFDYNERLMKQLGRAYLMKVLEVCENIE